MESRTIDLDGPVHYLSYDGPADGLRFVCVHGLGGSHPNWLSLAPMLSARGSVLVPDLAGHGRTPLAGRSASIHENRRLLSRFLQATGATPAVLVGNSMGGLISLMEAHQDPDAVAGVILLDAAAPREASTPIDRTVATLFATYMLPFLGEAYLRRRARRLTPEQMVNETLSLVMDDPTRVAPDVIAAHVAMAKERATMPWATTAFLQATRSMVPFLGRKSHYLAMLKAISAPVLIIVGRKDRLVPLAAAQAMARARPDWEFVVFDDLGHAPQLEDPRAVYGAIERWLSGTAAMLVDGRRREKA